MTLWLMSYINQREEGVPMPGKLAISSPGSALTAEEIKPAGGLITRLPAFFCACKCHFPRSVQMPPFEHL